MSFLKRLSNLFSGGSIPDNLDARSYWVHVRCKRCGEVLTSRVDLLNDLSTNYDTGQRTAHKTIVGGGQNRCFQRIEVDLVFDKNKKLVSRQITGGTFVDPVEEDGDEGTG